MERRLRKECRRKREPLIQQQQEQSQVESLSLSLSLAYLSGAKSMKLMMILDI